MAKTSLKVRLLTAVLAPVLVLGAVELCLRLFGYRYDPFADRGLGRGHVESRQTDIYVHDPELIWRLRPSTVLEEMGTGFVGVHTNSLGLRGGEIPEGEGLLKVLCLGDSITFGLGLRDGYPFPDCLLRALAERRGAEAVAVVNGGVPGWSSVQGLRMLERLSDWEPDVVVFWLGMNDAKAAWGVPDSMYIAPGGAVGDLGRTLRPLRLFQLLQQVLTPVADPLPDARRASTREFTSAVRSISERWGDRAIFVRSPERLGQTIAEFKKMIADAEATGVDLVLGPSRLLLPWTPSTPGTSLDGELMRTNEAPAFVYHASEADANTTLAALRESAELLTRLKAGLDARLALLPPEAMGYEDLFGNEPGHRVFVDNCHLSELGAELAAAAIAARIEEVLR